MQTELTPIHPNPTSLVLNAIAEDPNLASSTKTKYRRTVERYKATGRKLMDSKALATYAAKASYTERAYLSAVLTKACDAIDRDVKSNATPDNVNTVQATVFRIDAVRKSVKGKQSKGITAHTWLAQTQVKALFNTCDQDIVGQRDRLALGLMVSAGLRRKEAAQLRFEDVKLQPVKDRIRTVLQIHGKGNKNRVVPISDALANAIDRWAETLGESEGHILRSLGRDGKPSDSISTTALYNIVQKHGRMIDKPDLAPHDLRRTYTQIGYDAGIPVAQISKLLGHANIKTTMRYLQLDLDLDVTISDFVPF